MPQISNFSLKLKALRVLREMHQKELCEITGIHRPQLVEYERGRAMPGKEQLAAIEEALQIKFDDETNAAFAKLEPQLQKEDLS